MSSDTGCLFIGIRHDIPNAAPNINNNFKIEAMLKVLFVTSVSHPSGHANYRNYNHFQRVHFLSRQAKLTILAHKGADFTASAQIGTRIVYSPFPGKVGQILYGFLWFIFSNPDEVDIVITEPSILGISGFFCKFVGKCKWVVDIWDIPIRYNSQNSSAVDLRCKITRSLMKYFYRWADLFIVSIVPDIELRYFNLNKGKMLCLQNAIWLDQQFEEPPPSLTKHTFSILCTRSVYNSEMGLDILAKAFMVLREKINPISLTIIGHIPDKVRYQISDLIGLENVTFIEFVDHNRIMEIIRDVSICVIPFKDVPDLAQTYPVKVLEYLAMGKPVVASNIEGISRMLIDGKNGLLFKAGDYLDLCEKIEILYSNENLRNSLSENAKQLDENFVCVKKNQLILERLQQISEL